MSRAVRGWSRRSGKIGPGNTAAQSRGRGTRTLIDAAFARSGLMVWVALVGAVSGPVRAERPNVVLILTDDQGYGDLSIHGNPVLKTPNLDALARAGARIDPFYVSPVCAPTRASLLTGRYNYRTRVVDTYRGRAMMDPDEVTLAERLRGAGYRTGHFGKWHLGDHAPLRAQDQGFDTSLAHRGGGIGQPSDAPVEGGGSYLDPILWRDGEQIRAEGYVSDVLTDAAIEFVRAERAAPFFAYLAFNCPHSPYHAPESELADYRGVDLSPERFPGPGWPVAPSDEPDAIARSYAMIANIDANVGRLLRALEDEGIADETLVVFLTDNGPPMARFNAGLRGRKGSVYEGGIRVPCFVRWPGRIGPGSMLAGPAAHIDLAPTILSACGVAADGPAMDGMDLMPALRGESEPSGRARALFFQWHRGDVPEPGRAFAARVGPHKLLRAEPAPGGPPAPLELFDLDADPFERHDLAAARPDLVEDLRARYDAWFEDVGSTRGFDPPRIWIGSDLEDPVELTRQDWRGALDDRQPMVPGFWEVDVRADGPFEVALRFPPQERDAAVELTCGTARFEATLEAGSPIVTLGRVDLPLGPGVLRATMLPKGAPGPIGPTHVEIGLR